MDGNGATPQTQHSDFVIDVTDSTIIDPTEQNRRKLEQRRAPQPHPHEVPTPAATRGARFLTYSQDPSIGEPSIRTMFVPGLILNGPRDARIGTHLAGTTPVARNANGDFIFRPDTGHFDCAHSWAVVRDTLTLYERLRGIDVPWAWNSGGNTDILTVYPQAGTTPNAYYSRAAKALKFFYFVPQGSADPVYTCRSLDIVAHETGHAVLDGIKPAWLSATSPPQTGGLHESFGDLSAIFLALSQLDQAQAVMALSRNDLHAKNFIAHMAEQFGAALGKPFGLRNADNDLRLSQVGNEVHAISQVFTGAIYDIMADVCTFEIKRHSDVKRPSLILVDVIARLANLVLDAIITAPDTDATYTDVVNEMLTLSHARKDPPIYRTFIRNQFTLREVVVSPTPPTDMFAGRREFDNPDYTEAGDILSMRPADVPASLLAEQDRSGCCGTMQLPEFDRSASALAGGASLSDEELLQVENMRLAHQFR